MEAAVASQLSSIADLKVQQIRAWRSERMADAVVLASNPLVAAPLNAKSQFPLQSWLESFRRLYGYSEVAILDASGQLLTAAAENARPDDRNLPSLITAAIKTGTPQASDFENGPFGTVDLDFVAPVVLPSGARDRAVVLRLEASAFLYGLVQSWPAPSPTAECILVRKEGDRLRYLNEPRKDKKAPLEMTLPLGSDAAAAMAVTGVDGVRETLDYRRVPVVAALREIPETAWALVAKVDSAEIYSPLRQRFVAIEIVVALLLIGCLASFGVFRYLQESRFYKREHQADLARRALAGRYAHLSRCVNDIVLLLDESGKILEANDRAASAYGYSMEELSGMSIEDLLDASGLAERCHHLANMAKNGSMLFEGKHRRRDGSSFAVEVSCRIIESEGRRLHQSIIRDITERKRAEAALRRAVRAMRVLSASNQALVRSTDEASLFRAICGAATAMGGYRLAWIGFAEDDEQRSIRIAAAAGRDLDYLDSLDVTWADEPFGRGPTGTCIRTGQISIVNDVESCNDFDPWHQRAERHGVRSVVALPLTCDGESIGALSIYAHEPDAFRHEEVELLKELAGDLSYGIETHRQRLAQARTQEALMQSALEFRTLFDAALDSIFICDMDGRFLEVNQGACNRLGYSRTELLNMTVDDIDSPAFRSQQSARKAKLMRSGEDLLETVHIRKDGAELPVEISSRLFEYRGAAAILSVARDIRERKHLEAMAHRHAAELERSKTAAENASRAKSQFLANMSHEIRTPMNGIIGTSGLLLDTPLNVEQRDYAETIRNSAGALLAIVNDVLDFSKIEAGRIKLESVSFDIVARLEEIGDLLAPQARAKNLNYFFEADVAHRWVQGDAGRIRQIVVNLLLNAIKFTDQGHVKLSVSETPSMPGHGIYSIALSDTGIGIAALDVPLVFDKFTQIDSSLSKKQPGTGLGLAISRRLAQLMNATLTVTSELGKGATFVLAIPLGFDDAAPPPLKREVPLLDPASQRRRRVLLAEDNAVNQKIGVRLLEKCGCRVDLAANGREAIEMAERFPYDLIFMDCGMPEMDGYEATRVIRTGERSGLHIPIVALTAHAIAQTRDQCLASGMDDFIPKPVSLEMLQQALLRWTP